jgi:serine/threonine protein kinase
MLAQLTHPYVVGYVDSFFHQNYLCIVTEYCEGGDLYKRLKARSEPLRRGYAAHAAAGGACRASRAPPRA